MMGWCLKYSSPILAMAYMPIQPISASFLSFIIFEERMTWYFLVGGAVILIGLVLVIYGRHSELQEDAQREKQLVDQNDQQLMSVTQYDYGGSDESSNLVQNNVNYQSFDNKITL